MSKILAAHQPNFLPYLGFFDKMRKSTIFVIRDEVLFIERDYHHRNRIRINSHDNVGNPKSAWVGVPVENPGQAYLHSISIKNGKRGKRHWKDELIHQLRINYGKSPHFERFYPGITEIIRNSDSSLVGLNMALINFLCEAFGIKTRVVLASSLGLKKSKNYEKSDASEDLVKICKALDADTYLSGSGGKSYLDLEPFKKEGIKVEFQEYSHPAYPQCFPGFLPYMSSLDALFCVGKFPGEGEIHMEISLPKMAENNEK
jgi:hypothetical protein